MLANRFRHSGLFAAEQGIVLAHNALQASQLDDHLRDQVSFSQMRGPGSNVRLSG